MRSEINSQEGLIWRWFILPGGPQNSFYRLTPARRLLLAFGLMLLLFKVNWTGQEGQTSLNFEFVGVACVLLVLILELKDKLLARGELESGRAVQRAMSPEPTPSVPDGMSGSSPIRK